MRLITRNDTSLAIGLIVGAVVVFQQPLRLLLDAARDVELRYHLDLVPGLTIMTGVFIFHQYRKRLMANAEAHGATADAAQARRRSDELELLMTFSHDVARVLDLPTLQQVLWKHLPIFARERAFWVLARVDGRWQEVIQDTAGTSKRSMEVLEAMADLAVAKGAESAAEIEGRSDGEAVWFLLTAGGETVGVLGIHAAALPADDQKALAATAALMAIALRNVQLFGETREHSVRDRLTNCFNREHGLETLDTELRRGKRAGRGLGLVMFDIDGFKTINDELGHLRGDEILRAVGAQLARLLRKSDVSCRYGGDEFLVILPDTHLPGAEHVAETLRREIATLTIALGGERVLAVTASLGVAATAPGELDVAALITRTDEALYRAKRAGRNQVCVALAPGLPADVAPQGPRAGAPASATATAEAQAETILVADDEPLVHELVRRTLEPRGYTILPAKNAADAITIGEVHRGPIHLILTDVVMPDLHGPDLVQLIRRVRPEIKVLYVSGFVGHPAMVGGDTAFLQKPFGPAALANKVRETLDAPGPLQAGTSTSDEATIAAVASHSSSSE